MRKVLIVFGTRPEAIKMCPLVKELKARKQMTTKVCVTGQHRDMLDIALNVFGVLPDYDLDVMQEKQTLFDVTQSILIKMKAVLEAEMPDLVLVHGDTATSFAVSLSCYYLKISVGHVEAGLRTNNIYEPYPEEFNRRAVSLISRFHFAPTEHTKANLIREGYPADSIFVTGNTVIDALKETVRDDYSHPELQWAEGSRMVLMTAHRRENIGKPMEHMFRAIKRVVQETLDVKLIYAVHPNPEVRMTAYGILGACERIHLIEPLDVVAFHNFMRHSYLILSDSGGIQEEASAFGRPVLVMRNTTERPEGVEAGNLKLIGTDEESVYASFSGLLNDDNQYRKMCEQKNLYGDGFTSQRIADIIENW